MNDFETVREAARALPTQKKMYRRAGPRTLPEEVVVDVRTPVLAALDRIEAEVERLHENQRRIQNYVSDLEEERDKWADEVDEKKQQLSLWATQDMERQAEVERLRNLRCPRCGEWVRDFPDAPAEEEGMNDFEKVRSPVGKTHREGMAKRGTTNAYSCTEGCDATLTSHEEYLAHSLVHLKAEVERLRAWQNEIVKGYEFKSADEMLAWVRMQLAGEKE